MVYFKIIETELKKTGYCIFLNFGFNYNNTIQNECFYLNL